MNKSELLVILSNNLRDIREKRRLSQEELAEKIRNQLIVLYQY